jgi:hypothetical protein
MGLQAVVLAEALIAIFQALVLVVVVQQPAEVLELVVMLLIKMVALELKTCG